MTLEASLLPLVIDAVGEAAAMLVEESCRPSGPRGAGSKAEIDVEIERSLADRLKALLRGAGGVLLNQDGREVTCGPDGASGVRYCFGGAPEAARTLAAREWPPLPQDEPARAMVTLSWPRIVDDDALDRAKGCLFGQVIGDNLGALVEFHSEDEIAGLYPDGVRDLHDGGYWNILAGQATDNSELALALARTLLDTGHYDKEAVAAAYGDWYASDPFDCGGTIGQALSAVARAEAGHKAEAASS